MSKKISEFFNDKTKLGFIFDINCEESRTITEIKLEKEESFDIHLKHQEVKIKFEATETWNCKLKLENIKNEILTGQHKTSVKQSKRLNPRRRTKNNSIKVSCKVCNKEVNRSSLMRHMRLLHGKNLEVSCNICDKAFFSTFNLKKHLEMKHGRESSASKLDQFVCDFDAKIFNSKIELNLHMRQHFLKINCEFCGIEVSPRCMTQHIKDFHSVIRKYQCNLCENSFKNLNGLRAHIKNHNKKFECEICFKMFPTQGHLKQHKKRCHENPGNYECEICNKKFNTRQAILIHQRTHEKNRPKPHKCPHCDYATDLKYSYNSHIKLHERKSKQPAVVNTIKCSKCPALLKNKRALAQHLRHVHISIPWQCDLCGNYLKTLQSLKRHIKRHIQQRDQQIISVIRNV